MKKYKITSNFENTVDKVICNMCEKEIKKNEFGYLEDFLSIKKLWGFGSKFDSETHNIDICQNCYNSFLKILKISPD